MASSQAGVSTKDNMASGNVNHQQAQHIQQAVNCQGCDRCWYRRPSPPLAGSTFAGSVDFIPDEYNEDEDADSMPDLEQAAKHEELVIVTCQEPDSVTG
ncbi:hypothetical protein KCU78_g3620, partial [Aureobasidium melanogenum]